MTMTELSDLSVPLRTLDRLTAQLAQASSAAKLAYRGRVLDASRRVLLRADGLHSLAERAPALEAAGIFSGTDWATPAALLPGLVGNTLRHGESQTVVLETLSLLRFLHAALGEESHPALPAETARHFLTQVLALNLDRLTGSTSEADREATHGLGIAVDRLLGFLMEQLGADHLLAPLVDEVWRLLSQRPLRIDPIKSMITQIAVALSQGRLAVGEAHLGADRLISALFGPSGLSRDDPGLVIYQQRLEGADDQAIQAEAAAMARAMHDTGLVSDYHATLVTWMVECGHGAFLPNALGLSSTGIDALRCYEALACCLIREAVRPATAQAVLGLALMLERGILYDPPVAPSLWRLVEMPLSPAAEAALTAACGSSEPPRVRMLAGVLMLLGNPLGIGQGNNPTCQSARALAMWALNDPDYLLWLLANVLRHDRVVIHFEGKPLDSGQLPMGLVSGTPLDADPVSVLLVPQIDRIYAEMGRRVAERGEDPHRWINPELHGWWVGRDFHIAVDVATGKLHDHAGFLRRFHASYHPLHNGNQIVIHPQPAGIAVTDSLGRFVGWHAIAITRVALDPSGEMRVYFFNPNNDSGQNWGCSVILSTSGKV
ncbi:hypothetical protein, partial [Geoalkalibacter halelectricus]|uniref:hypothetical protein n=1 Tax=Geoalkalibacter halelectricus TaxID=2847045 RepID=UPI003D1EA57B